MFAVWHRLFLSLESPRNFETAKSQCPKDPTQAEYLIYISDLSSQFVIRLLVANMVFKVIGRDPYRPTKLTIGWKMWGEDYGFQQLGGCQLCIQAREERQLGCIVGGMLPSLTAGVVSVFAVLQVDSVDIFDMLWKDLVCIILVKRNWTTRTYALPRTWIIGDVFHRSFDGIKTRSKFDPCWWTSGTFRILAGKFPVTYDFGSHRFWCRMFALEREIEQIVRQIQALFCKGWPSWYGTNREVLQRWQDWSSCWQPPLDCHLGNWASQQVKW